MQSSRLCKENNFATHDNVSLFYRYWPAQVPVQARRGAVLLFHRGHEHSGRMSHLVDELNLPDFDFFAWDSRGHGKSPGARGDSPGFSTSVRDVQTFVEHIAHTYGWKTEDVFVIAQSVGAVLISTWVHDYAPRIRGMALASPAFKVKLYVPFARSGLSLLKKIRGNFFVNSYVKSKFLTHDVERQKSYDSDPLISRPISVTVLLGLYETSERVVADAQAIITPTLLLTSDADWVVHQEPQLEFFNRLSAGRKKLIRLPGFYHDTLGERDRHLALQPLREFLISSFDRPLTLPDMSKADQFGPSFEEAQRLATPLATFSPKGIYWRLGRANIKLGGYLSKGIKLGHDTGFDSGSTLDYVYRNEAQGSGLGDHSLLRGIGRGVDRHYLNAIGWRGIRQRKLHLQELLLLAVRRCQVEKLNLNLLDIAAGHGRYVLDAIEKLCAEGIKPDFIHLRDYSDINVTAGMQLIKQRGLQEHAVFKKGDAFDANDLAAIHPQPSIGIVSGLYELFPENHLIKKSLHGLSQAIKPGGYLIYTNQPWHPQLELIARTLTSHRSSQDWVMRRRSQAEMDQLVMDAGFKKITQRVDEWGIFSVSLAQRNTISE
jgi:alpha-beta hydrolase superfamily lysophospholipase